MKLSDKEYYEYLKFCSVNKEELLSREECYKLVRDPKYKEVLIAREKFDFLECEVEQISLF